MHDVFIVISEGRDGEHIARTFYAADLDDARQTHQDNYADEPLVAVPGQHRRRLLPPWHTPMAASTTALCHSCKIAVPAAMVELGDWEAQYQHNEDEVDELFRRIADLVHRVAAVEPFRRARGRDGRLHPHHPATPMTASWLPPAA